MPVRTPLAERFWPKVDKTEGCWLWTAARNTTGYGTIGDGAGGKFSAHRVAYEWTVGPIPAGYEVDHLCRVKHCVNPAHLEAVTPLENSRRGSIYAGRDICDNGHPFVPETTYMRTDGGRRCMTCKRERDRVWKRSKDAARREARYGAI